MIKARSGDHFIYGLSAGNIERLKQGKPIFFPLSELGMPSGTVTILYGETEEDIKQQLIDAGMRLPPP